MSLVIRLYQPKLTFNRFFRAEISTPKSKDWIVSQVIVELMIPGAFAVLGLTPFINHPPLAVPTGIVKYVGYQELVFWFPKDPYEPRIFKVPT